MKSLQVFLLFFIISGGLVAQDTTNYMDKYKISNKKDWSEKRMSYYLSTENKFTNDLQSFYHKGFENMRFGNYDSAIIDFKKSIGVSEYNNNDWQTLTPQKSYHPYFFIGICKKSINENDSAIIYLHKSMDEDTNFEDTYLELAILYAIEKQTKKGLYYCNQLLELNEKSAVAHYLKAQIYYYNHKNQPAIKALKKAIKADPDYIFAHLLMGDIYYKKHYARTAAKSYSKVIELDPELALGYTKRGLAYFMHIEYELALTDLEKSYTLDTSNFIIPYFLGYVNIVEENYKEGIKWMSIYIEKKLEDKTKYFSSSFSALEIDDIVLTLNNQKLSGVEKQVGYKLLDFHFNYSPYEDYTTIPRFAKNDTSSVFGSRLYNYFLFLHKGYTLTPDRTNKLISKDSTLIFIMALNAELRDLRGDSDKSIGLLDYVIETEPNYTNAYNIRGEIYMDKGELNNSLQDFEYALSLNTNFHNARYNRGECYYEMEMYSQALSDFQTIKPKVVENQYLYNSIAKCYGKMNEKNSALTYFSKSIKISPYQHEAYYYRGKMFFDAKKYEAALRDFNSCISYSDKIPKYHYERAMTYMALNRNEFAVFNLKHVVSLNPKFPEAYCKLGRIYYKAGKFNKCIKYSTLATQEFPESFEAYYNIALSTLRLGDFKRSLQLYIKTATEEIEQTQSVNKNAIDDLEFLIENNLHKKEAEKILYTLLNIGKEEE